LRKEFWITNVPGIAAVVWLMAFLLVTPAVTQEPDADRKPANGGAALVPANGDVGAQRPVPAERNPRYRIGRDDVLSISFPLSPELNQRVVVQPDGFISLQSAGSIHVEGLTAPALTDAIKKAYGSILHAPIVDVDITDFQKPLFTVLGQVGKPGQYTLRHDITVSQAIAVAGGFSPSAKTQVFLYRAVSDNWAEVRELKLKDLLGGKNIAEDVHLRPGDMIFVPENFITKFKKYVPYSFSLTPPYPAAF